MKDDKTEKIIIIGAGISGLSAGIYGQKHGFVTEIYEKNPVAGGLCATWKRDNFPIDGCIHWMTGTKEGTEMRSMWDDLEAFTTEDIIHPDNFGSVKYEDTTITFWCDLKRLERELIEISPKDKKLIKRVIYIIYKIQNMPLPTDIPLSEMSLWRKLRFAISVFPYLKMYAVTRKKDKENFAKKFKSPALRYAFENIVPGDENLYAGLYGYGTVALRNGGVLKGGSSTLINNMVRSYQDKGGIIHYNSEIQKIIIENNKAIGIQLKNGDIRKADRIIAACDVNHTYHLIEKKYRINAYAKRFNNPDAYPTPSCVYISMRVNKEEYEKLGISRIYLFKTSSYMVGKREFNHIPMRCYSYDEKYVVNGDTLLTILLHQSNVDYNYWNDLYLDRKRYLAEKNRIAEAVLNRIVEQFPSLKGKIKVIDVTTPKTYNRYTNAYCGAYMPFAYTSKGSIYYSNGKFKHLKNLQLATQWCVLPGGVPIAMMSGKFAIQRILKEKHKWYKISKPIRFIYRKSQ